MGQPHWVISPALKLCGWANRVAKAALCAPGLVLPRQLGLACGQGLVVAPAPRLAVVVLARPARVPQACCCMSAGLAPVARGWQGLMVSCQIGVDLVGCHLGRVCLVPQL